MHQWFRKGNARRFHRVDMPLRYFVIPSSPLEEREIYATGVNYFPKSVLGNIEGLKFATVHSLERIQDQKELISAIVNEIIADVEFYGLCLQKISNGEHPKKDPNYWMQIKGKLSGFTTISKIKESSPKTFQYFKLIEDKYLAFLNALVTSINGSDEDSFQVEGHLPVGFKLDETMKLFKQEKFSRIPLVQTILHLAELLEAYLEAHRQINDDNYIQHFPQEWPLKMANISASGLAVLMPKLFDVYSRVNVFLYFEESSKYIQFEGTVVDIREIKDQHLERIAINFEFPNGNDQNFVQQEIQKQEVKECMKYTFFD